MYGTERQVRELHIGRKRRELMIWQLTGPEPATSRSIAGPLAAEVKLPLASFDPFPSLRLVALVQLAAVFSFPSLSYHV